MQTNIDIHRKAVSLPEKENTERNNSVENNENQVVTAVM
jgi:hypothetical protein